VVFILIGRVVDNIWSTKKDESLLGMKLMFVELMYQGTSKKRYIVAADMVGAGIGERVLVTQGSSARKVKNMSDTPIDALIVGIIDEDCEITNV